MRFLSLSSPSGPVYEHSASVPSTYEDEKASHVRDAYMVESTLNDTKLNYGDVEGDVWASKSPKSTTARTVNVLKTLSVDK